MTELTCNAHAVRSSSLATVPYSMKNLIACFDFSSDVQRSITAVLQPQKWEFTRLLCYSTHKNANFNFVVLSLMYHALIPATREKLRAPRNRTRSTLFQSVCATNKPGDVCPRHLQEGERRENACPPVAYISDLIRVSPHVFQLAERYHLKKINNLGNRAQTKQRKKIRRTNKEPHSSPQKKKVELQPRSKAVSSLLSHRGRTACFLC